MKALGKEVSVHTPREELAGYLREHGDRGAPLVGRRTMPRRAVREPGRVVAVGRDVRHRASRGDLTAVASPPQRPRGRLSVSSPTPPVANCRTGSSELNDPVEQRARFEDQARLAAAGQDETMPIDEDYIKALEWGLPPTAGLGLGMDRLAMLIADESNIREVIAFPTLKPMRD